MKRLLATVFLLFTSPAQATISCTLPVTLQNNTLADATQVMSDFNALVTCLASAAAAGANSDITSLSGLTTPIAPASGGTPTFISSVTSTGTANAQTISSVTPSSFTLTTGYKIIFKAGFTNTGPTTFNVNGTGATNVFRRTSDGIQAAVGGEIIANSITEAVYDGTQFQLIAAVSPFPVGTVLDTIAAAADPGFALMQGQCLSTTTFSALWIKMGSPVAGSCALNNFALPDGRGRVVAMIDSGGSARITVAGGNFDGTVLYGGGGLQNLTLAQSDLPNVNQTVTITDPGHSHTYNAVQTSAGIAGTGVPRGTNQGFDFTETTNGNTTGISAAVRINGNVTQTLPSRLQPTIMLNKQVKY